MLEIIKNDETEEKELEMLFYHKHLPLLNDIGLVDWDQEAQSVWRGRSFDDIRPLLEIIAEDLSEHPVGRSDRRSRMRHEQKANNQ